MGRGGGVGGAMFWGWTNLRAGCVDGRCAFPLVLLSCLQKLYMAIVRIFQNKVEQMCEGKSSKKV